METKRKLILFFTVIFISYSAKTNAQSDSALIVEHLKTITKTDGYRNYKNITLLNQTAEYILSGFRQYADTAYYQNYQVEGVTYRNVVCRLESENNKPLVVIGAHYDVCGNQEGADDNASGVVGLLEAVRLLSREKLNYPIEIVAYCLEEPPFFRSEHMGSYIHAKSLYDANTPVYGMVVLEMIGYFNDRAKSQSYPVKAMKIAYGRKGHFILLARKAGAGEFVKKFSAGFNNLSMIETRNIKAPSKIQGLDFSDHLNYWKFGYDALMVTNTAFYRNHNYHQTSDTMETLDISKMMKVIDATVAAIVYL